MSRTTDARFKVKGCHVDGTNEGTLTIKAPTLGSPVFVSYRPKGKRHEYQLPLAMLCGILADRAAKMGTIIEKHKEEEE